MKKALSLLLAALLLTLALTACGAGNDAANSAAQSGDAIAYASVATDDVMDMGWASTSETTAPDLPEEKKSQSNLALPSS